MQLYICSNCKFIVSTNRTTCLSKGSLYFFQNFPEALLSISQKMNVSDLSFDCFCVFNSISCKGCKAELGRFYITKNENLLIGRFTYSLDKNYIEISKYAFEENSIIASSCATRKKIKKNKSASCLNKIFELEEKKIKKDDDNLTNDYDLWKICIEGLLFLREKEILSISSQFKNMEIKFKKLDSLKDLI